jgi:predicted enzyme related to lactoylglutathione lyase
MSVDHVLTILATPDLTEAVEFYRAALGWVPAVETPAYVEFTLERGQRVGLYDREGFGRNTGQVPARTPAGELAPTELYLCADDLQSAVDRVRRAGARELSPPALRPWGDEAAYFADPCGNVLVLARPAPPD